MSTNQNLFKEAVAEAKIVRETALVNAKAALEEALTPRLQSMLSAKLQEMEKELDEEDYMSPLDTADEMGQSGFGAKEQGKPGHGDAGKMVKEEDLEEDFDLSEILAELDEAKKDEEGEEENDEEEEGEEEEGGEEETSEEEEENVADMSVEDLKDLIKSIVNQEIEAEEAETPDDEAAEEMGIEMGHDDGNEIDLEELLAELDALEESDDNDEDDSMKEAKSKKDKAEKELEEAITVINTLRNELNEVNLLNAKLLYVNKIFNAKNLTESQKLKVISSFDKATTVKEAKMVFESLNSALNAPVKKAIKESLGFASKAAGIAPNSNKAIVETNDAITRMQKLANIIK